MEDSKQSNDNTTREDIHKSPANIDDILQSIDYEDVLKSAETLLKSAVKSQITNLQSKLPATDEEIKNTIDTITKFREQLKKDSPELSNITFPITASCVFETKFTSPDDPFINDLLKSVGINITFLYDSIANRVSWLNDLTNQDPKKLTTLLEHFVLFLQNYEQVPSKATKQTLHNLEIITKIVLKKTLKWEVEL